MPPQRQERLRFKRTVVERSIYTASTRENYGQSPTPQPATLVESASVSPASSAPSTPLLLKDKIRTSWVFNHIPDEDMQKKYYNEVTRVEEWRCWYCSKAYAVSGSTSGPAGHLMVQHKILRDSKREVKAQNIQRSMEQVLAQVAANPQKRRRLDTEEVKQDELEALWVRVVVSCNLSLRLVENPEFRVFI